MRQNAGNVAGYILRRYVPLMALVSLATALMFPLDNCVEAIASGVRTPGIILVAEGITVAGNVYYGVPVLLALVLVFRRKDFKRTFLATALAVTAAFIIKNMVSRPRPIPSGSFDAYPSGHTAASFALFGSLSEAMKKRLLLSFPLLIGISRILLGRHYLSDVVMGAGIGLMMALASEDVMKIIQRSQA